MQYLIKYFPQAPLVIVSTESSFLANGEIASLTLIVSYHTKGAYKFHHHHHNFHHRQNHYGQVIGIDIFLSYQGGRSWQTFGEGKIKYLLFPDKCVVLRVIANLQI